MTDSRTENRIGAIQKSLKKAGFNLPVVEISMSTGNDFKTFSYKGFIYDGAGDYSDQWHSGRSDNVQSVIEQLERLTGEIIGRAEA